MRRRIAFPVTLLAAAVAAGAAAPPARAQSGPLVRLGTYQQEVAGRLGVDDGLPTRDVRAVAVTSDGAVWAGTALGLWARFGARFVPVGGLPPGPVMALAIDAARGDVLVSVGGAVHRIGGGRLVRLAAWPAGIDPARPQRLAVGDAVLLGTHRGLYAVRDGRLVPDDELARIAGGDVAIVALAAAPGEVHAATARAILARDDRGWRAVYPADGARGWAPREVRALAYDRRGRPWFASPQGAGCRRERRRDDGGWRLITGADGLPWADFTSMAAGEDDVVWFGTRRGAIRHDAASGEWEYRQGPRWLPDDEVRDVAVSPWGDAYLATPRGIGVIERRWLRLQDKARFFEEEIDRRHRRPPGYVLSVRLAEPGDRSRFTQHDSDNDGLWTSMYGAGECFAYAATGDPKARERARSAFEALRFLGEVTRGGEHEPPAGFVARTVLPTAGPDPNRGRLEQDRRKKATEDALWKVIDPRWPRSADGQWYWKCDTSSDELDGHYFFYARYHDLVASTAEEKAEVAAVVAGITDHLIEHDYRLIDHDGEPTRWAHFGPADLNHAASWWEERGLNSLSMISYLRVAEHVTGDPKYGGHAARLIAEHGYKMNVMNPKVQVGPGSGNQSDDEMAFMRFYDLLSYERDPELRRFWAYAFHRYWRLERPERNPLFDFMYAAVARGAVWEDAWGRIDLSPTGPWLDEAIDTLQRYPLDRVDWPLANSHRLDVVRLSDIARPDQEGRPAGHRVDGKVLPIDERHVEHWNHDPWRLDQGGQGRSLADGASFLLPYYMGLYHRFIDG